MNPLSNNTSISLKELKQGLYLCVIKNGDEILIDIPGRRIDVKLSDEEIKTRLKSWKRLEKEVPDGYMKRYVKHVGSAVKGAVLD